MSNSELYLTEIWNKTLSNLFNTKELNEDVLIYFNGSKLLQLEEGSAIVTAPSFINFTIMNSYKKELEQFLSEVIGKFSSITIIEEKEVESIFAPSETTDYDLERSYQQYFPQSVAGEQTFGTFVVGRSNAQARAAADTCAKNPGYVFNPLFIYGESGIGKTHLLNAIANEIKAQFPKMKIGYITGTSFVDDIYYASKNRAYDEMKQAFKSLDLLLVDDIQFIANKPKSHEMFFDIFNFLVNNKKQIVVTSDKSPNEIGGLEDRLVTRFNQGLTVNIEAPEYETAVNILKMKISNNISISQQINEDVISYIATNFSDNVRSLEGALTRLLFYSISMSDDKDHITLNCAVEAFKDQIVTNRDSLSFYKIIKAVSEAYNISKEQIKSKNRTKNILNARHVAIYLSRMMLDESFERIGAEFGGRDHTTIMNSCEKVEKMMKEDNEFCNFVKQLEKKING